MMNRLSIRAFIAHCAATAAILGACGKDDSLGDNDGKPLNASGSGGISASTGGANASSGGSTSPSGGKGSGGASNGGGGASPSGGKSSGSGGDCGIVTCLRAIECVAECDGPVLSSGCCPCSDGSFDQIECMNNQGGAAGAVNTATGGAAQSTGGSGPTGSAGEGGADTGSDVLDTDDAIGDKASAGSGDCAGTTLGAVIDAIHLANQNLADIVVLYDPDNLMVSGAYILAFATPDGFRLVFTRGSGDCPAGCINREYWYFETDAQCEPVQVGHYARGYAASGCVAISGEPLWGQPPPFTPNDPCPPPDLDELNANCVDDACPSGLTPTFFYGLAGTQGPRFCWCTIGCDHEVDLCPDGTKCTDIGDGPSNICYEQ